MRSRRACVLRRRGREAERVAKPSTRRPIQRHDLQHLTLGAECVVDALRWALDDVRDGAFGRNSRLDILRWARRDRIVLERREWKLDALAHSQHYQPCPRLGGIGLAQLDL